MKYQVTVFSEKANEEPYFVCYANSEAEADFFKGCSPLLSCISLLRYKN